MNWCFCVLKVSLSDGPQEGRSLRDVIDVYPKVEH